VGNDHYDDIGIGQLLQAGGQRRVLATRDKVLLHRGIEAGLKRGVASRRAVVRLQVFVRGRNEDSTHTRCIWWMDASRYIEPY
jgi:hypothetical protein